MSTFYKKLNRDEKVKILTLNQEGLSIRQISDRVGCAQSTVVRLLKKKENQDPLERKKGTGPSRTTTEAEDRIITRISLTDRFKTASQIKIELEKDYSIHLSVETVRRKLREIGLFGRKPAKTPLLSHKMKSARLKWAEKYREWTEEDWGKVVWSDESKFNIFCSDSSPYVRRKRGEIFKPDCTISTVKHPASQMVWGCFSYYGLGRISILDHSVDAQHYQQIITECLTPSLEQHLEFTNEVIFQDDSAPSHRAKSIKNLLDNLGIQRLDWPGNSPDLNPIEHLWHLMKRKVAEKEPKNKKNLRSAIEKVWYEEISAETLQNLVNSMPRRVMAVIQARGGSTRY